MLLYLNPRELLNLVMSFIEVPQRYFCLFAGRDDIREVVDRLIFDDDKHLTREEKLRVVENVLRECDNDEDGALCFPEFQQAMAKSPDFIQLFKMYI